MTNLKKITALLLASVMSLSSVAFADFTDAKDIKAEDAVSTLTAIGIIKGYEDDSFKPEGTVTRAEMAKMIFTLKNGGNDDASAFMDTATAFNDVNGHWAQGYIKYCEAQSIIDGKEENGVAYFDPDANVTGTEALKMALGVIGYDERAGLTGASWDKNTLSLATEAGLTDDYGQSVSADAQRQYAAQILYNTLGVKTVKYNYDFLDFDDQTESVGSKYLDLVESDPMVLTVVDKIGGDEFITDVSKYLGEEVTLMYNDRKDVIYGVKPTGASKVETGIIGDLDATAGTIDDGDIAVANITAVAAGKVIINGAVQSGAAIDLNSFDANSIVKFTDGTTGSPANYTPNYVIIETVEVAKVTYVNDEVIRATGAFEEKLEDMVYPADIAKGDYVAITYDAFEEVYVLETIEMSAGDIEAVKGTDFRIDGTWYKFADGDKTYGVGDSVEFYNLGKYAYAIDVVEADADAKLYVIAYSDDTNGVTESYGKTTQELKVLFEDGSIAKGVKVTKLDGANIDDAGKYAEEGAIYTYEVKDGEYKLENVTTTDARNDIAGFTSVSFDKDTKKFVVDATDDVTYAISDTATIYARYNKDGSDFDYAVLTGTDVKGWKDTAMTNVVFTTKEVNGIDYVDFAFINFGAAKLPGTVDTTLFAVALETSASIKVDGDTYFETKVWNGEEEVVLQTEVAMAKQDVVKYELLDDGTADITAFGSAVDSFNAGAVVGIGADEVKVQVGTDKATTTSFTIGEDTQIFMFDFENNKGYAATADDIELADLNAAGNLIVNVVYGYSADSNGIDVADVIIVGYKNMVTDADNDLPKYTVSIKTEDADIKSIAVDKTSAYENEKVTITVTLTDAAAADKGETVTPDGTGFTVDSTGDIPTTMELTSVDVDTDGTTVVTFEFAMGDDAVAVTDFTVTVADPA